MSKSKSLADRIREVILSGTWVANTNFKDQLEGLDWKIATRQIPSGNTIAVLAQHIHYYINGIKQAYLTGNLTIRDAYSFDFPPIASQEEWERFLERFWDDTEQLARLIEALSDADLEDTFIDEKYGSQIRNINGMIEHSYYHLGQIVWQQKHNDA